ncbi:hypothetical protein PITC_072070 [Penicillium italicum]|uniref:Uncharacterized protein n=1 Tax=Penicillium italicum TaxID=40296 RepID=A0A0A2KH64_PENIT|nr:hypothetical protein PITC_072070 [Penicillium italicum]
MVYMYILASSGGISWHQSSPTDPQISHNAPNTVFGHLESSTGKLSSAYTPQRMPHNRFCSQ